MRRLIASTFVSLDGVMQAPGAPEEDKAGGFAYGGWTAPYWDEETDIADSGFDAPGRELLLGRRTYDIFAAYWPKQPDEVPIAKAFNATRKHVASRTLKTLAWNNSVLLAGDVAAAVAALKKTPGKDLQVIGSGNLLETLHAAGLVDEYNLWTYPVVLGKGKRLFEPSATARALKLVSSRASKAGVVMSRYVPAGEVKVGTVGG